MTHWIYKHGIECNSTTINSIQSPKLTADSSTSTAHTTHFKLSTNIHAYQFNYQFVENEKCNIRVSYSDSKCKWWRRAIIAKISPRIGQNTSPEQHQCIDLLFKSIAGTVDQYLLHRWLVLRALNGDCARTIVAIKKLATAMCTSE